MKAEDITKMIRENKDLQSLELEGFKRGEERGKKLSVPLTTLAQSLRKQTRDFEARFYAYVASNYGHLQEAELKRALADIRNVAGALFLKVGCQPLFEASDYQPLFEEEEKP